MKILSISMQSDSHGGGVEKHSKEVTKYLSKQGYIVKSLSKNDIKYPEVKFLGLLYIWLWFLKNRKLIQDSDLVQIHDVFIWYLPFKFIFPNKKVFTTFHGWEGVYPIPFLNKLQKKIANRLSSGTIAVGRYIEKYYGIKADKVLYGGQDRVKAESTINKTKNMITFVGRLEQDTGVIEFLRWLDVNKKYKANFVGDGDLKKECMKYGTVWGFSDPTPFYKKSQIVVPAGYLAYIEAKSYGCKVITFANSPLKEDYWREIKKVKTFPTWDQIADEYISLYNNI